MFAVSFNPIVAYACNALESRSTPLEDGETFKLNVYREHRRVKYSFYYRLNIQWINKY